MTLTFPQSPGFAGQSEEIMITAVDPEQTASIAEFQYHVTFGDGKSEKVRGGSDLVLTHTYRRTGSFVVTVTATDNFHRTSNTARHSIKIARSAGESARSNSKAASVDLSWVDHARP